MKCRSVACIWSDTPFPHRVTAVAALPEPPTPTFYTAGSNGSVIWWTLSTSPLHLHQRDLLSSQRLYSSVSDLLRLCFVSEVILHLYLVHCKYMLLIWVIPSQLRDMKHRMQIR